jgi:hypothetical protein
MPTKAVLYKKANIDMKPVAKVYQEALRKRRDLLFGFWVFTSITVIVTVLAGVWLFTLFPLLILAPSLVCTIVLGFLYRWLEGRLQHLIYDEDTETKSHAKQDSY